MISINEACFGYGNAADLVLSDLSVHLDQGECLAVMGPSGSGKSTLLRLIAGELTPSHGQVSTSARPYLAPESLISQSFRTVLANALFVADLQGRLTDKKVQFATEALGRVGLGNYLQARPRELSRGMAARLSFVQTMVGASKLVLLDEPFASLDVKSRRICENAFVEFSRSLSLTSVVVTHDFGTAVACADKVLFISGAPMFRAEIIHRNEFEKDEITVGARNPNSSDGIEAQQTLLENYLRLCDVSV